MATNACLCVISLPDCSPHCRFLQDLWTGLIFRSRYQEHAIVPPGDRLVLREHRRLAPLAAGRNPLGDLASVKRGDCVVAFARREVLVQA